MSMTNFLTSKFNIIEENNKFIEELDIFLKKTLISIIGFLNVFHIFFSIFFIKCACCLS
jgi:hypothetical protein